MSADTSAEAVERLAKQHVSRANWGAAGYEHAARNTTVEHMFHDRTAATLRALLAERDRLAEAVAALDAAHAQAAREVERLRDALIRLRDCDWVITPLDRMDAVREIARAALAGEDRGDG